MAFNVNHYRPVSKSVVMWLVRRLFTDTSSTAEVITSNEKRY